MKKVFENTSWRWKAGFALMGVVLLLGGFWGCGPTYPEEHLPEAVKQVCKDEYGLEVDVARAGGTLGIYYPMEELLDVTFGIREEAWESINNLILIASRVVLSTDADIRFYTIIAQDVRLPEIQVVIIKYVDDVKRAMYRAISRDESFRRTLFSNNLTPQAEKERSVERVFDSMQVDDTTRDAIMNEFFRTQPTSLRDIGYWRGRFYLKDITMEEFLAEQMANRVKIKFLRDDTLPSQFRFGSAEGDFVDHREERDFVIDFEIADLTDKGTPGSRRMQKVERILTVAGDVISGYGYEQFDRVVLNDRLDNARITAHRQDILDLSHGVISVEEAVKAPLGYF